MKRSTLLWIALALLLLLLLIPTAVTMHTRSVFSTVGSQSAKPAPFDPEQSAAFIVGVRKFDDDSLIDVAYGVDDAIDLAYSFAMVMKPRLVRPDRIVLVLGGTPQKDISKERLVELKAAGVKVASADQGTIVGLLEKQSRIVGQQGVFLVHFATHGFNKDGISYVLAKSSRFLHSETAIAVPKVLDLAASSAGRSIVFIDACREKVDRSRSGEKDPRSNAPDLEFITAINKVKGQVVFYAAAAGGYAHDDSKRKNGVFTAAVIEGLEHCRACTAGSRLVTAGMLADYVEESVRNWIRTNKDPHVGSATQISLDGNTKSMPLTICGVPPLPPPTCKPKGEPARIVFVGSTFKVLDKGDNVLWPGSVGGIPIDPILEDLDGNGHVEVIMGVDGEDNDKDSGKVVAFDACGHRIWSQDTSIDYNGRPSSNVKLQRVLVTTYGKRRSVITLSIQNHRSRLALFAVNGKPVNVYWDDRVITQIMLAAESSRHKPKILIASAGSISLIDLKKIDEPLWTFPLSGSTIAKIEVISRDNRKACEIAVMQTNGRTFYLDFKGHQSMDEKNYRPAAIISN